MSASTTVQAVATYSVAEVLSVVADLAVLNALDDPSGAVPVVSARSVSEATRRARQLLTPHLDHTRPRKGAFSALVSRGLLGVRDDDICLALSWLDAAAVLLLTDEGEATNG